MQEVIVALIVLGAALAVLRKYLPKTVRRNGRNTLARLFERLGMPRAAGWLAADAEDAASCADGCGSCGGCGTQTAGAPQNEFSITPETLRRTARH